MIERKWGKFVEEWNTNSEMVCYWVEGVDDPRRVQDCWMGIGVCRLKNLIVFFLDIESVESLSRLPHLPDARAIYSHAVDEAEISNNKYFQYSKSPLIPSNSNCPLNLIFKSGLPKIWKFWLGARVSLLVARQWKQRSAPWPRMIVHQLCEDIKVETDVKFSDGGFVILSSVMGYMR